MFSFRRRDPDLVLGQEAPGLAGEDVKSPVGVVVGDIGVSQTRSPAVALIVQFGSHEATLAVAKRRGVETWRSPSNMTVPQEIAVSLIVAICAAATGRLACLVVEFVYWVLNYGPS